MIFLALLQCGALMGVSETFHHFNIPALDWDVASLSHCFRTLVSHNLGPFSAGLFLLLQEVSLLFSSLPTGEMILSGGKDGIVAVSSPRTGMTIHVLADHKGSPITVLQCTRKQVRPQERHSPHVSLHSSGRQHGQQVCFGVPCFASLEIFLQSLPATCDQFFQGYIQWNKAPCVAGAVRVRLCLQGDLWWQLLTPCCT